MRQLYFWLEIDEQKHIYQKVKLSTISHGQVSELQILNLETNKSIVVTRYTVSYSNTYMNITGFLKVDKDNFQIKGFYFYTHKPRLKKKN